MTTATATKLLVEEGPMMLGVRGGRRAFILYMYIQCNCSTVFSTQVYKVPYSTSVPFADVAGGPNQRCIPSTLPSSCLWIFSFYWVSVLPPAAARLALIFLFSGGKGKNVGMGRPIIPVFVWCPRLGFTKLARAVHLMLLLLFLLSLLLLLLLSLFKDNLRGKLDQLSAMHEEVSTRLDSLEAAYAKAECHVRLCFLCTLFLIYLVFYLLGILFTSVLLYFVSYLSSGQHDGNTITR